MPLIIESPIYIIHRTNEEREWLYWSMQIVLWEQKHDVTHNFGVSLLYRKAIGKQGSYTFVFLQLTICWIQISSVVKLESDDDQLYSSSVIIYHCTFAFSYAKFWWFSVSNGALKLDLKIADMRILWGCNGLSSFAYFARRSFCISANSFWSLSIGRLTRIELYSGRN